MTRILFAVAVAAVVAIAATAIFAAVVWAYQAANGSAWKSPQLWLYVLAGAGALEGFSRGLDGYEGFRARLRR